MQSVRLGVKRFSHNCCFSGTIKRKPSMKPSLPLTSITRQLKEVGETRDENDSPTLPSSPVLYTNTGTLTRSHTRRKSTNLIDESPSTGTLKRYIL